MMLPTSCRENTKQDDYYRQAPSENPATPRPHLSVHEEAQCERDSHGAFSKLLFTAHGGGGGVVGGGVGGLCGWETHEGRRPRGVWSREPFGEPGEEPLALER